MGPFFVPESYGGASWPGILEFHDPTQLKLEDPGYGAFYEVFVCESRP